MSDGRERESTVDDGSDDDGFMENPMFRLGNLDEMDEEDLSAFTRPDVSNSVCFAAPPTPDVDASKEGKELPDMIREDQKAQESKSGDEKKKKVKWIWGYLNKMGEVNKAFKNRVFLLKPDAKLRYYNCGDDQSAPVDIKQMSEPLGVIPLKNGKIFEIDRNIYQRVKDSFMFGLTPSDTDRTYVFEAASRKKRDLWMGVMAAVGCSHQPMAEASVAQGDSLTEGWMEKMGEKQKANGWKARYFVCHSDRMVYFKDFKSAQKKSAAGTIVLGPDTELDFTPSEVMGKPYCFTLSIKKRTYLISASDPEDKKRWQDILSPLCT